MDYSNVRETVECTTCGGVLRRSSLPAHVRTLSCVAERQARRLGAAGFFANPTSRLFDYSSDNPAWAEAALWWPAEHRCYEVVSLESYAMSPLQPIYVTWLRSPDPARSADIARTLVSELWKETDVSGFVERLLAELPVGVEDDRPSVRDVLVANSTIAPVQLIGVDDGRADFAVSCDSEQHIVRWALDGVELIDHGRRPHIADTTAGCSVLRKAILKMRRVNGEFQERVRWLALGGDAGSAREWLAVARVPDLGVAQRWLAAGFSSMQGRAWITHGFPAEDEAVPWRDLGVCPPTARVLARRSVPRDEVSDAIVAGEFRIGSSRPFSRQYFSAVTLGSKELGLESWERCA